MTYAAGDKLKKDQLDQEYYRVGISSPKISHDRTISIGIES